MKTFKTSVINLSMLLITIIIALLIGESLIRFLYKDTMVLFPRYHTSVKYGDFSIRCVRPNMNFKHRSIDGTFFFKTNNRGFRNNSDIEYAKSENEIRVLCLGDSHTQGFEVNQEETFSIIAQNILENRGMNATVINTGVSGFSTAEELIFLENEGIKYQPDFIVVGFFANDFSDNVRSNLFEIKYDSLVVNTYGYTPKIKLQNFIYNYKIILFLRENSYLFDFTFDKVLDLYNKLFVDKIKIQGPEYAVETKQEFTQYELDLMKNLISEMYRFTSKSRIPLIILDIPQENLISSIPDMLVEHFIDNSDTLFYVNDLIPEYEKLSKIHVNHGQRHISAETHYLLGNKIANYVFRYYKQNKNISYQ